MWYWVVMALLIATAVGLTAAIFITAKKNNRTLAGNSKNRKEYEKEESVRTPRRRRVPEAHTEPVQVDSYEEERPRRNTKKQWKVLLENLETWEKYTYIFYDNIGIGRSKSSQEFEKFLTVQEDPRVSKVHCAIVRKGDKLYLRDLGSRNGTYLNGQRISQPVVLQKDDVIGVGETKIELQKVMRERD